MFAGHCRLCGPVGLVPRCSFKVKSKGMKGMEKREMCAHPSVAEERDVGWVVRGKGRGGIFVC